MITPDQIEKLARWGKQKEVPTHLGPRLCRRAKDNPELALLYERHKAQLRAMGIVRQHLKADIFEFRWWAQLPSEIVIARQQSLSQSSAADADIDIPVPPGLQYLGYQKAGIRYAADREGTLIADEMGLGKTIQAIGLINLKESLHRVLIICPAHLKIKWFRECKKWLVRKQSVGIADGSCFPSTDIVIINFQILGRHTKKLEFFWDLVVVDEAHEIRNPGAQRSKAILGYRPKPKEKAKGMLPTSGIPARYRVMLSGTPMANRPIELYPLLRWLNPKTFAIKTDFAKRYCGSRTESFKGSSNEQELGDYLRSVVMVRRLKKDVLKELPAKRREVIELPASAVCLVSEENKALAAFMDDLANRKAAVELSKASGNRDHYQRALDNLKFGLTEMNNAIAIIRRQTAMAKIPLCIEHIRPLVEEGNKIILFGYHREAVLQYHQAFKGSVMVRGGMPDHEKMRACDAFQNNENCRVIAGNMGAMGTGLDLTAGNLVIFTEESWLPLEISQCEDRCILEGQEILTVDGWRAIETIKVGESVIGHDGKPHKVTDGWSRRAKGSHSHNSKLIASIEVRGWFKPIQVTTDHKFLTSKGWSEAQNIRPGDKILMPEKTDGSLTELLFDADCRIDSSFVTKPIIRKDGKPYPATTIKNGRLIKGPEKVDLTDEAMFVFGYYLGDGFSQPGNLKGKFVSFSGHKNQKATHLARCEAWMRGHSVSSAFYYENDGLGCELRAFSGEWAKWFTKHFGRTLATKRIPEWVFGTSIALRISLLNGLVASDGYSRPSESGRIRSEIITASWLLAADITRLLISIGEKPCVIKGSKGQFSIGFSLGEKPELAVLSVAMRHPNHTERVYDLTVEGSESFVAGTSIVHNCHRLGQQGSVFVQHLVLEGSIDCRMAYQTIRKQETFEQIMDGKTRDQAMNEPIIPMPDGVTVTFADIERESALINQEQIMGLRRAVQVMMTGKMNLIDMKIAESLAGMLQLTRFQAVLARKLAERYRGQIDPSLAQMCLGTASDQIQTAATPARSIIIPPKPQPARVQMGQLDLLAG